MIHFLRRHGLLLRSWLVFLVTFGALHALMRRHADLVADVAITGTAHLTAWTLGLLGAEARVVGAMVISSVYSIEVIFECTAVFPMALFAAAVLAHPCRWRSKLLGLVLGLPAMVLINLLRLVSLCYVGRWFPAAFDTAHLLVWQSLMIFFTVLLWMLWAGAFGNDEEVRSA